VLISIRHHHWWWVEREDFLWRHQPYFGFMLVKQLKATIEKVAVLFDGHRRFSVVHELRAKQALSLH
jgi:hypothetical protein